MIEEILYLINEYDISGESAEEIINIYFDDYIDWRYKDYLRSEIAVFHKKDYKPETFEYLESISDNVPMIITDTYIIVTAYGSAINLKDLDVKYIKA